MFASSVVSGGDGIEGHERGERRVAGAKVKGGDFGGGTLPPLGGL